MQYDTLRINKDLMNLFLIRIKLLLPSNRFIGVSVF